MCGCIDLKGMLEKSFFLSFLEKLCQKKLGATGV